MRNNNYSIGRIYILVNNLYSGSIHSHQISELAELLGTTSSNIKRKLSKLIKAGYMKRPTDNWYHIVSWRKLVKSRKKINSSGNWAYGSFEIYDEETGNWFNNKVFNFDINELINNYQYLRTFCYAVAIKLAHKATSRNSVKSKNGNKHANNALRKHGLQSVSLSFINNFNRLNRGISTISTQLHKAVEYGLIELHNQWIQIGYSPTKRGALIALDYLTEPHERSHCRIVKVKNHYQIVKNLTNSIKILF